MGGVQVGKGGGVGGWGVSVQSMGEMGKENGGFKLSPTVS